MRNKVRIIDIAERAGVSKGTVDRVIHNRGNVAPDVELRILKTIEELGFTRNKIASALAYNKNWKVACLLPDSTDEPFWALPAQGVAQAMESIGDYGFSIQIFTFPDNGNDIFSKQSEEVLQGNFDLVLVAPLFSKEANLFFDRCNQKGLKYVQINTRIKRDEPEFLCYIGQDSYHSGTLAAKLLDFGLDPGDQVIVLHLETAVYNSEHLLAKQNGFEIYFNSNPERNIEVIKCFFDQPHDQKAMKDYFIDQLAKYPNIKGIFVTTSKLHFLIEAIGEDLSKRFKFVGFDLIEENLKYLYTDQIHFLINQNPIKQGFIAMMNIFNHLTLKSKIKKEQYLPLHIVMKENVQYYLEAPQKLQYIL